MTKTSVFLKCFPWYKNCLLINQPIKPFDEFYIKVQITLKSEYLLEICISQDIFKNYF